MIVPSLQVTLAGDTMVIAVAGDWRLQQAEQWPVWPEGVHGRPSFAVLDGSQLASLDPSGAWWLQNVLGRHGLPVNRLELRGFSPATSAILALVGQHAVRALPKRGRERAWVVALGKLSHRLAGHAGDSLRMIGHISEEMLGMVRHPGRFRLKETFAQFDAVFVQAIALVSLMMFLLGVVFTYLLGRQAMQYGASIYVVDGTTLATCRELSPVLVAILVAGRSGSAITAQLGTMKFDEELDALRVLGLSPWTVLIIPRLLALVVAMPLLVFMGDLAGIAGSMLIADLQLAIPPAMFIDRIDTAIDPGTVITGLAKAPLFGTFIGLIACHTGLKVERNARSIGLSTTATVVESIVAVILLNAIIAVSLSWLNL